MHMYNTDYSLYSVSIKLYSSYMDKGNTEVLFLMNNLCCCCLNCFSYFFRVKMFSSVYKKYNPRKQVLPSLLSFTLHSSYFVLFLLHLTLLHRVKIMCNLNNNSCRFTAVSCVQCFTSLKPNIFFFCNKDSSGM